MTIKLTESQRRELLLAIALMEDNYAMQDKPLPRPLEAARQKLRARR